MNSNLELKAQAWVDGELSASDAQQMAALAASDAALRSLALELRQTRAALTGNEVARPLPETREFFWSKIERQIQREATSSVVAEPSTFLKWRRWISAGAGVAAFACILMLALKTAPAPKLDELSTPAAGMEAVTFHDQSASMTVIWLENPAEISAPQPAAVLPAQPASDSDIETE